MTARTRIVMSTFEYGPIRIGGLAAMVTALCSQLDRTAFEPVVVLPRSGYLPHWPRTAHHAWAQGAADVYRDGDCEIWLLSGPLLDGPIYPEPAATAGIKKIDEYGERLAELLVRLGGDVLHLHDAYGYKALYAARQLGLPTLLTVHRLHEDEPPTAFGELAAVHLVDAVSTVSAAYARERNDFFAPRSQVHIVPNGIDLTFWDEVALSGPRSRRLRALQQAMKLPAQPTFAYVGRLDGDQKGLDVLLAAYARCHDEGFNLIIAGDGDRAVVEQITAAAAHAPTRAPLRFVHRQLAPEEVRAMLGAIDAVVIPSRYEPFGLIQLEAMALGALPVASRVGGLRDVIVDLREPQGFGRLVESGDAAALAGALGELAALVRSCSEGIAAHPELDELRRRGRARALRSSARAMAEGYQALYLDLIARSSPRTRHVG